MVKLYKKHSTKKRTARNKRKTLKMRGGSNKVARPPPAYTPPPKYIPPPAYTPPPASPKIAKLRALFEKHE
jgi:hypothetical protein